MDEIKIEADSMLEKYEKEVEKKENVGFLQDSRDR